MFLIESHYVVTYLRKKQTPACTPKGMQRQIIIAAFWSLLFIQFAQFSIEQKLLMYLNVPLFVNVAHTNWQISGGSCNKINNNNNMRKMTIVSNRNWQSMVALVKTLLLLLLLLSICFCLL